MRLLLDTHALLWWLDDNSTLATNARETIANRENLVAVSAATAWEIAIKRSLGKLSAPDDLEAQIAENGFESLPITVAEALMAGSLPRHHDDPFDRMLVAQASLGGWTVVTRDSHFADYGVEIVPA